MALTRITKGVIKPNENYDTHNINSTGIITSTKFVGAIETTNATITGGSITATTGTFSGSVSIGGTLTYEDVTNIDSVGIVTAREGVFIPDNKEIKIGNTAGTPDLKIYHSSSNNNSYIEESGSGYLITKTNRFEVTNAAGTEALINAVQDSGVKLYDGTNTARLETTSSGATVTGKLRIDISSTGGVGSGNAEGIFLRNTNETDNNAVTIFGGADDYNTAASAINFINVDHSANYGDISFDTRGSGGYGERLRIASNGEITQTGASGNTIITLKRSNTNTTGTVGGINFAALDGHSVASIQARGDGNDEGAHIQFYTTSAAAGDMYNAANVERLRITSGGDVTIPVDSKKFLAGAGNDVRMFHDGSDSYFDSITGNLYVYNHASGWLDLGTAGTTRLRITAGGVVETYGGGGGAALRVKSGGDIEIYAANNSNKVTLYCDNNNQLSVTEKIRFHNTSGGVLRANGNHALKPTGGSIQTVSSYGGGSKFTNSSSSYQTIMSHSMTIESGNKVLMMFDADMNADSGGSSWQIIGLRIGSQVYAEKIIEHDSGKNMNATIVALTGALSAGSKTIEAITKNGGGQCSYNEMPSSYGLHLISIEYVS